jgi:excisionase family DNA binding protein
VIQGQGSMQPNAAHVAASPWLTVKEAADRLRLSESYLSKAVSANRCPHRHVGRRILIHVVELDAWALEKPGVRLEGVA